MKTRSFCGQTTLKPRGDEVNFNPQVLPPQDSGNGHVATCCAVPSGTNPDDIQTAERETSARNSLAAMPQMSTMAISPTSTLVHDQGTPCSTLSLASCCDGATSVAAEIRSDQKAFSVSLHEVAHKHDSVEASQSSYLNKLRPRTQPLPIETPRNLNRESVKVINATSSDPVNNHSSQNSVSGTRCCQCRPTNKTCCHQKSCRCRSLKTLSGLLEWKRLFE